MPDAKVTSKSPFSAGRMYCLSLIARIPLFSGAAVLRPPLVSVGVVSLLVREAINSQTLTKDKLSPLETTESSSKRRKIKLYLL